MTQESFEERLIWLLKISRSMIGTREIDRLVLLIANSFIELTEAERGYLFLHDATANRLTLQNALSRDGSQLPAAQPRLTSIASRVFKEGRAVYATDTDLREDPASRRSGAEPNLKMMICVPLRGEHDEEPIGVWYGDGHTNLDRVFTSGNRNLVAILAEHATAAIENARLFERATNDPLTGLPNSSYFLLQLAKVMRESSERAPGGVLLLDLDAFKRVNLVAGAEAGDRALIDVATTLQDVLRTDGLVARYGSDKFAVLLSPEDGSTQIALRLRDVAERARAAINTKTFHGVHLSACIGGIAFPAASAPTPTPDNASDIIALADDVLAQARSRGVGEVEIS